MYNQACLIRLWMFLLWGTPGIPTKSAKCGGYYTWDVRFYPWFRDLPTQLNSGYLRVFLSPTPYSQLTCERGLLAWIQLSSRSRWLELLHLTTIPIQKLTIDYTYLSSTPVRFLALIFHSLTHLRIDFSIAYELRDTVCGSPFYSFNLKLMYVIASCWTHWVDR